MRYVIVDADQTFAHFANVYRGGIDEALVSESVATELVAAGLATNNTAATVSYMAPSDRYFSVDTSTAAQTVRVRDAAGLEEGEIIVIADGSDNAGSNNITIEDYDGAGTLVTLNADSGVAEFRADGNGSYTIVNLSSLVV